MLQLKQAIFLPHPTSTPKEDIPKFHREIIAKTITSENESPLLFYLCRQKIFFWKMYSTFSGIWCSEKFGQQKIIKKIRECFLLFEMQKTFSVICLCSQHLHSFVLLPPLPPPLPSPSPPTTTRHHLYSHHHHCLCHHPLPPPQHNNTSTVTTTTTAFAAIPHHHHHTYMKY
jgi:hypothetical protein